MKSSTPDAVAYVISLSNERYQEEIRRSFQRPESAEIFGLLLRYGSLTRNDMAALSNPARSRNAYRKALEELRECGYIETCNTLNRVYRLSDKSFLDPETDRPSPSDIDTGELIAVLTGGKGRRRRKTASGKIAARKHQNKSKKQRIERNNGMSPRTRLQISTLSTLAVFENDDLMGEVAEYLDAKNLLFAMVVISKRVRPRISYEHAIRCAMATERGRRRMQHLTNLIREGCIYTPSPMRILKLATGRRCENCNRTQTNKINGLGVFFCTSCILPMVKEAKPRGEQSVTHVSLFLAAIHEDRCAKLIRSAKKTLQYFMYTGITPFRDRENEKVGPLVSVANLTAVPSSVTLIEILESVSADDPYRSKIPSILEACEKFHPMGKTYNHLGIVDHSGPFRRRSMWQVLVQWENGERTWQPLTQFAMDDFESCESYAKDHGLLDTLGWRRFR